MKKIDRMIISLVQMYGWEGALISTLVIILGSIAMPFYVFGFIDMINKPSTYKCILCP